MELTLRMSRQEFIDRMGQKVEAAPGQVADAINAAPPGQRPPRPETSGSCGRSGRGNRCWAGRRRTARLGRRPPRGWMSGVTV